MVHQLFVLHEAPPTEVTGPRAPGHRGRAGRAGRDESGGRRGASVGEEGGQQGPPDQGERRPGEELLCKIGWELSAAA